MNYRITCGDGSLCRCPSLAIAELKAEDYSKHNEGLQFDIEFNQFASDFYSDWVYVCSFKNSKKTEEN
jgi:hypothetical protein